VSFSFTVAGQLLFYNQPNKQGVSPPSLADGRQWHICRTTHSPFAQPAARARDDDDFSFDVIAHNLDS